MLNKYKQCPDCNTRLRDYDYYCKKCGHIFRPPRTIKK